MINYTDHNPLSVRRIRGPVIVIAILIIAALGGWKNSPLLLGAIVGLFGLVAVLVRPQLGIVAIPVLALGLEKNFSTGTEVPINIAVLLPPLLAGLTIARSILFRRPLRAKDSFPVRLFLAFGLVSTASFFIGFTLWSPLVPKASIAIQLGQLFIYFSAICAVFAVTQELTNLVWLKRLVGIFLIFAGLQVVGRQIPYFGQYIPVPMGSEGAMVWVWLAAMAGSQLILNHSLPRIGKLGLTIILLFIFLFLLRRMGPDWLSGWFPTTVSLLTILLLRFWRFKWLFLLIIGLVVILSIGGIYEFAGGDEEVEVSGGSRLVLWQAVLDPVWERPIFGLGMVAYRYYHYNKPLKYNNILWFNPRIASHNDYIDVFAQTGILGLGTLTLALFSVGYTAWRLRQTPFIQANGFTFAYANGVLAGLVGTGIAGMLGNWVLPFVYNGGFSGMRASLPGWLLLGGLAALDLIVEDDSNQFSEQGVYTT